MHDQITVVEGYPEAEIAELSQLFRVINDADFEIMDAQLKKKERILACFAFFESHMVGYKIGFEQRPRYFESWIGGVHPEHRGKGIATALMKAQHDWCRSSDYTIITTICAGDNQPMLMANLTSGFEICGTFFDRRTTLKVTLQKMLE
jgi:GNAT superfamily N-acetyltransferase